MLYILIPSGSFLPFLEDFVVCELIEQQQESFKLLVAGSRAAKTKIDSRWLLMSLRNRERILQLDIINRGNNSVKAGEGNRRLSDRPKIK